MPRATLLTVFPEPLINEPGDLGRPSERSLTVSALPCGLAADRGRGRAFEEGLGDRRTLSCEGVTSL